MKRIERNTYNSLRKSVTASTINVEIPTSYTKEGRQGIHEMLTTEKNMVAVRINWNNILEEYVIHYIPSNGLEEYETKRMQQENADIDEVMNGLSISDYTWNGYKKPTETETETTENDTNTEIKKEANTMKSISISNLTLDLYAEYVKPACLVAGIMELVENDSYTRELVDAAAAVAIERCMTEACFDANCTENDTVFDQAEEMLKALGRAIEVNRYGAGETLAKLREALEKALNASKDDIDEGFERFEAAEESMYKAMAEGIIRRQGGFREKDIIAWPHYIRRGTWNDEHKVVEIISKERDAYGYRNGCAVDIITRRIVG